MSNLDEVSTNFSWRITTVIYQLTTYTMTVSMSARLKQHDHQCYWELRQGYTFSRTNVLFHTQFMSSIGTFFVSGMKNATKTVITTAKKAKKNKRPKWQSRVKMISPMKNLNNMLTEMKQMLLHRRKWRTKANLLLNLAMILVHWCRTLPQSWLQQQSTTTRSSSCEFLVGNKLEVTKTKQI